MHDTFFRALPDTIRARAESWVGTDDPNDEVGAIWRRIARGTLVGAGFGRDLFELRDDPAAAWVAAFGVVSGDDPVTMSLTTRAMFARFGEDLVEPVERVAAYVEPGRGARVGRALRGAAGEAGTPPGLQQRLLGLAAALAPEAPLAVEADPRADALWAEIYAHPDDLTPRWVLADVYTERGDPRGPFMVASLKALATGGGRPRGEAALLLRHEAAWLGDFRQYVGATRVWRGGVLAGCTVRGMSGASRERREWRVMQELRFESSLGLEQLSSRGFPSLRVLGLIPVRMLHGLEASGLLDQLDTVYVWTNPGPPDPGELGTLAVFSAPQKLVLLAARPGPGPREAPDILARFRLAEREIPRGALWPPRLER